MAFSNKHPIQEGRLSTILSLVFGETLYGLYSPTHLWKPDIYKERYRGIRLHLVLTRLINLQNRLSYLSSDVFDFSY